MKVIQKGRKQRGWAMEFSCIGDLKGGCGAKLLVEEDDIYETGIGGDGDDFCRTFRCPECGVETHLPAAGIPTSIWEKTMGRRSPVVRKKDKED
jgi:hypothetical protein